MASKPAKPGVALRPWHPSPYENEDAWAIKALASGTANEHQQRRALDFIINKLAGTYDVSFRADSTRETDHAEGKRWVGLQLVKLVNLPPASLNPKRTNVD